MGKTAIILVASFMLMGGVYTLSTQRGIVDMKDRMADHEHEILSRNAAMAGFQQGRQMLADNFAGGSDFTGTYNGTDYEVDFSTDSGRRILVSEGQSRNAQGEMVPYQIKAVYATVIKELPEDVPAYQKYAAISDDDMTLAGNIDAPVYAEGDEANELNANVHTNGFLTAKGGGNQKNIIKGYGSYVTGSDVKQVDKVFDPENPTGNTDYVYQAEQVTPVPTVNTTTLVDSVSKVRDVETISSELIITPDEADNYEGSRQNPKVMHVQGNLIVSGNVVLDGYSMFIVDGDVRFSGDANLRAGQSGYTEGDESSIALYAGGTVDLRGNTEVWAQIYANKVISGTGTADIYGGIASAGQVELKGGPTIHYRVASPALQTEGFVYGVERGSYNEWAE